MQTLVIDQISDAKICEHETGELTTPVIYTKILHEYTQNPIDMFPCMANVETVCLLTRIK